MARQAYPARQGGVVPSNVVKQDARQEGVKSATMLEYHSSTWSHHETEDRHKSWSTVDKAQIKSKMTVVFWCIFFSITFFLNSAGQ